MYNNTQHEELHDSKSKLGVSWLTVWIHGARPFGKNYHNLGLKHHTAFACNNSLCHITRGILATQSPSYSPDKLYVYSWTGSLSKIERLHAARDLKNSLEALIAEETKRTGIQPKIRIIAHSHGGNVVLNLATIPSNVLRVDELVLLAVPVQHETLVNVTSPLFKRVFSLYSTIDIAQIIDPQGLHKLHIPGSHFFSSRRFKPQSNLLQAHVLLNGIACMHSTFNCPVMVRLLPSIIDELNAWLDVEPHDALSSKKITHVLSLYTKSTTCSRKNIGNNARINIIKRTNPLH